MGSNLTLGEEEVFKYIWKGKAPSKVLAFSWMFLLNRIQTRVNLSFSGIFAADTLKSCVL